MPRKMLRRYRIPSAAGFDSWSVHERRQADLFLDDLLGRAPRAGGGTLRAAVVEDTDLSVSRDVDVDDLSETTFTPEDLAPDMAGLDFVLAADGDVKVAGATTRFKKGTVVTVVKWDNGKSEIEAKIGTASATVPKELIEPKATMYQAKVTTPKRSYDVAIPLYAANLKARRDDVLKAKAAGRSPGYKELNKHLIIEMQLNRLDSLIGRWSFYYDTWIGEPKGWKSLAPGWVKSMMVQESTMGSSGRYLVEKADEPWKTRFNVLQAIDSWGFQQYLMIEELEPGLLKKEGLDRIMDDRLKLEKELEKLDAQADPHRGRGGETHQSQGAAEHELVDLLPQLPGRGHEAGWHVEGYGRWHRKHGHDGNRRWDVGRNDRRRIQHPAQEVRASGQGVPGEGHAEAQVRLLLLDSNGSAVALREAPVDQRVVGRRARVQRRGRAGRVLSRDRADAGPGGGGHGRDRRGDLGRLRLLGEEEGAPGVPALPVRAGRASLRTPLLRGART